MYFLWPTLLSELGQMNYASSERVTNFLEKSAFTWRHLVSAAKCSKECTSNHFWQIFSFLRNFDKHWENSILEEQTGQ